MILRGLYASYRELISALGLVLIRKTCVGWKPGRQFGTQLLIRQKHFIRLGFQRRSVCVGRITIRNKVRSRKDMIALE